MRYAMDYVMQRKYTVAALLAAHLFCLDVLYAAIEPLRQEQQALFTEDSVSAQEKSAEYEYEQVEDGGIVITAYRGSDQNIILPANIDGFPVTALRKEAFSGSGIKSILLSSGIKELPRDCFKGCHSLQSVTLPASLRKIGAGAFYETDLIEVVIPPEAARRKIEFGFSEFKKDESRITVSPLMTLKNRQALRSSGYDIPIDENDFYWANKSDFDYSSCHEYAFYREGYTYIYDSAEDGRGIAIQQYLGTEKAVVVPAQLEGRVVTEVSLCRLDENRTQHFETVELPPTVRTLATDCFANCKELVSVQLPDGLSKIGNSAFYGASGITELSLPASVRFIGNTAFSGTNIKELVWPEQIRSIGSSVLSGTLIEQCTFPAGVPLTAPVFGGAKLLKEVILPEGLTEIPADCFAYCISLTSVHIPDSVERIGERAFRRCSALKRLRLPKRLTSIASGAFLQCTALYELDVPPEVSQIVCEDEEPFADSRALSAKTRALLKEIVAVTKVGQ